jgi:hypothetical protein
MFKGYAPQEHERPYLPILWAPHEGDWQHPLKSLPFHPYNLPGAAYSRALVDEGGAMDTGGMSPPGAHLGVDVPLNTFGNDFTMDNMTTFGGGDFSCNNFDNAFVIDSTGPLGGSSELNNLSNKLTINNMGLLGSGDITSVDDAGAVLEGFALSPDTNGAPPDMDTSPIAVDCPHLLDGTHPNIITLYVSLWTKSSSTHKMACIQALLKLCLTFETAWVLSNNKEIMGEQYNVCS